MPEVKNIPNKLILNVMEKKEYKIFTKNYDLNIVGVRSSNLDMSKDEFNDMIFVFWMKDGFFEQVGFKATTDPGRWWLQNPPSGRPGTAVLMPGQYRGCWQVGLHKGQYPALVQVGDMTVARDANRDTMIDYKNVPTQTGLFGINLHRASPKFVSQQVDKWSAGCQVLNNKIEHDIVMNLARLQIQTGIPNIFSYTLLLAEDF
jgi:hypothetical protein